MGKLFVLHAGNVPAPRDTDWHPDDLCLLETEVRVDQPPLSRVKIDGTWRTNRWFDTQCLTCKVNLVYIGWTLDGKWSFRWKCPECGNESQTMHKRYRPPIPDRPFGGKQKHATAVRRGKSGY